MTLRLAFLGTPDFAVPTLAELVAQGHDIACVYSQPPRPKGRGLDAPPSPVHEFALTSQLAVRTPATLKDAAQQELFADLELDAAIVVAYGLLLPKPILDAPGRMPNGQLSEALTKYGDDGTTLQLMVRPVTPRSDASFYFVASAPSVSPPARST